MRSVSQSRAPTTWQVDQDIDLTVKFEAGVVTCQWTRRIVVGSSSTVSRLSVPPVTCRSRLDGGWVTMTSCWLAKHDIMPTSACDWFLHVMSAQHHIRISQLVKLRSRKWIESMRSDIRRQNFKILTKLIHQFMSCIENHVFNKLRTKL